MENGRKKIRICLTCVVLAAVVIGLFYYYYEVKGDKLTTEGTLIANVTTGFGRLWR